MHAPECFQVYLLERLALVDPEGADVVVALDGEDVVHDIAPLGVLASLNNNTVLFIDIVDKAFGPFHTKRNVKMTHFSDFFSSNLVDSLICYMNFKYKFLKDVITFWAILAIFRALLVVYQKKGVKRSTVVQDLNLFSRE